MLGWKGGARKGGSKALTAAAFLGEALQMNFI